MKRHEQKIGRLRRMYILLGLMILMTPFVATSSFADDSLTIFLNPTFAATIHLTFENGTDNIYAAVPGPYTYPASKGALTSFQINSGTVISTSGWEHGEEYYPEDPVYGIRFFVGFGKWYIQIGWYYT